MDSPSLQRLRKEPLAFVERSLSLGHHTIHFVGIVGPVASPFVEFDETYNITVVR